MKRTRWIILAIFAAVATSVGCNGFSVSDPCTGVACSGRGYCFTDGTTAFCSCFESFVPRGLECVEDQGCLPEHCSGHGVCREVGGVATGCDCDDGYQVSPDGFFCLPGGDGDADGDSDGDGDGDADNDCTTDGQCLNAERPYCDVTGQCAPCPSETFDCSHIGAGWFCSDGACIECDTSQESLCVGQDLVCDTDAGRCVECLADADCDDDAAAACDPDTHRCVPCEIGLECINREPNIVCDTESTPHRCVECTTSDDCLDPARARCVANECTSCEADDDCQLSVSGECKDGLCACYEGNCVPCNSNQHCAAGAICNYRTNQCVQACMPCDAIGDDGVCDGTADDAPLDAPGLGFVCGRDFSVTGASFFHCLQRTTSDETPVCERPWIPRQTPVYPDLVCAPPTETSCMGILEFGNFCDASSVAACGENGTDRDAVCTDEVSRKCSWECSITDPPDIECPIGAACIDGECR